MSPRPAQLLTLYFLLCAAPALHAQVTLPASVTPASMPAAVTPEQGTTGLLQTVPRLVWRRPDEVEGAFARIKALDGDLRFQAAEHDRARLDRLVCRGLVDFRALPAEKTAEFAFRDHVRGRSWMRPAVALTLIRALAELRKEIPTATMTIGDATQPGCGQVRHSVLVRWLEDTAPGVGPATAMANKAAPLLGVLAVVAWQAARDLPEYAAYFTSPDTPVRVETQLVGQDVTDDGRLILRTATRRFRRLGDLGVPVPESETKAMWRDVKAIARDGELVRVRKIRVSARGEQASFRWLQHWIDPDDGRQLVLISRQRQAKRKPRVGGVEEVRIGLWQERKPDSFPKEVRWYATRDKGGRKPHWEAFMALREAGHESHNSGRDVDVSYVTMGNTRHFAVDLKVLDVAATWRWFQILERVGRDTGVPLDKLMLEAKVARQFRLRLPPEALQTSLWRNHVGIVPGHDAHHHVRTKTPSAEADAKALEVLMGMRGR